MRISAERAAKDFNKYLANKHALAARVGGSYELNMAQLSAEINTFLQETYKLHLHDPRDVPTVDETEAVVRKLWKLKAQETRKARSARKARLAREAADAARQYALQF